MAKKIILIVVGSVGILIGLGLLVVGAILIAVTGGDGFFSSGNHALATPTRALVSQPQTIRNGSPFDRDSTEVQFRIRVNAPQPVFLGVGRAADVDSYLDGVQIDEITSMDFSPFRVETLRRDGEATPATPTDQTFWVAKVTGAGEQTLNWTLDNGDFRVVLMNVDGSEGVQVQASFGVKVPFLRGLGIGFLGGGGLIMLVGLLLLVLGVRVRTKPAVPAGYPPGYPAGYPGGTWPAGGYPAPGQYPYPPPGQYPQPGQYPPGQYPPAQYPQPGQYPPPPGWPPPAGGPESGSQPGAPAAETQAGAAPAEAGPPASGGTAAPGPPAGAGPAPSGETEVTRPGDQGDPTAEPRFGDERGRHRPD